MTNREFLNAVTANETLPAEVREFAQNEIAKLDKRNEARKGQPSKSAMANEPIKMAICEYLAHSDGAQTSAKVAEACGITISKASSLLTRLVADGKVVKGDDVKVEKRKVASWKLA